MARESPSFSLMSSALDYKARGAAGGARSPIRIAARGAAENSLDRTPPGVILGLMTRHPTPPSPEPGPPSRHSGGLPGGPGASRRLRPGRNGSVAIRTVFLAAAAAMVAGGALSALAVRVLAPLEGRAARGHAPAEETMRGEDPEGPCLDAPCLRARLEWGNALQREGALAAADSVYARAAEEAVAMGLPGSEADAMILRSGTRLRLEGLPPALALLDSARTLPGFEDPVRRGWLQCQRGRLLAVARSPEAESALEAGLAELGVVLDPEPWAEPGALLDWESPSLSSRRAQEVLAGCLFGLGQSYGARSRTHGDLAVRYLAAAAEVQARLGDEYGRAASLQWLASTYRGIGHYLLALQTFEEALLAAGQGGNVSAEAWARFGRFALLSDLGDRAAAAADLRLARQGMEASGDRFGLAYVARAEAEQAALEGRPEEASRLAELSVATLEGLGDARARVEGIPLRLALARMARDTARVVEVVEELLEATGGGRTPLQAALPIHAAAAALLSVGEVEEAARLMTAAGGSRSGSWGALYAWDARRAEVAARRGDLAAAAAHLDSALEWLALFRGYLYEGDLRGGVLSVRSVDVVDPDLGLATVVSALSEGGMVEEAFAFAAELRARELEADRIRTLALAPEEVTEVSPAALRGGTGTREVRAHLTEAEALLFYETGRGGEPTTLFVVTGRGVESHQLPELDALAPLVNRLESTLAGGEEGESLRRHLGALLLDPALAALPPEVERLVIIPSQGLLALPFDALLVPAGVAGGPTSGGGGAGEGGAVALVARFSVAYTPSPGLFVALRSARLPTPTRGVLALGRAAPVTSWDGSRLPRLRWVSREVRGVARRLPGSERRLGARATTAALLEGGSGGWAALHVAAHARVDADLPARSALYLAPDPTGGDGEDGVLHLAALERARLAYPLVVLSACTTAGGAEDRGEGLRGLARAFLGAGAQTVIASPWPVSDRVAARQMAELYRLLGQGIPAAEALAQVKRQAIAAGAPPREWAAFRVMGDPSTRLTPPDPGSRPQPPRAAGS
jgi:CHAT domain-containing protein/tetratricopeptide (TPR) repeat protein